MWSWFCGIHFLMAADKANSHESFKKLLAIFDFDFACLLDTF